MTQAYGFAPAESQKAYKLKQTTTTVSPLGRRPITQGQPVMRKRLQNQAVRTKLQSQVSGMNQEFPDATPRTQTRAKSQGRNIRRPLYIRTGGLNEGTGTADNSPMKFTSTYLGSD